jgi:predicted TIM-barrel fold metal-dependent hydrolase
VSGPIIDVNVHLSRWAGRRILEDETARLVGKLRGQGVIEAWAGSFDALLHKDLAAVNARLAEECRAQTGIRLIPFGSVNPLLPDWEEELRRCAEDHRMPGIRLYPNYHGYKLDHPALAAFLKLAAERRLVVALAALMEDERMMLPVLRVPPVDLDPLPTLVERTHPLRLVVLNALGKLQGEKLLILVRSGEVYVEISHLERVGGVANLLTGVPLERILFGSHAPFFYFESAVLKLKEAALSGAQIKALQEQNARRLMT